ncbi:hypothetical protein [Hoeflea sp.]|jgi:hypothetical protein|uniref:hypothetical protein n=1 Tax=Hoeflea sp. TaxID=1940281 RepID=UPI001992E5FB|nr:hypothetical protein [Hoeflea sp.]MBC7286204.1 hypothetical protein [Hoeflea sp.]
MTELTATLTPHRPAKRVVLGIFTLVWFVNAVWMLADPAGWYASIDGVPNTGPYNPHFVRDIGVAYLVLAALSAAAIRWPAYAVAFLGTVTLYLGLHALLHVWDIAAARLPVEHILIDLPGVFLPPLIAAALTWWCAPARSNT